MLRESLLASQYQLIIYHRRGFAGSTHPDRPLTIAEQAADGRGLLRALGIDRAHIAGHSYGGAIALQLALDAPSAVHSLVLLEPALLAVPSAHELMETMAPVMGMYQSGDKAGAVDAFLRFVVGPDYRSTLDTVVPGGYEQAVVDADTFFAQEMPALDRWQFTREDAHRITQPVLAVVGAESATLFKEGHQVVREWLPKAEGVTVPGVTHGLQLQDARAVAEVMVSFLSRHPLLVQA